MRRCGWVGGPISPVGFERRVREVFETCKVPATIVGVDCSEPPCLALVHPGAADYTGREVQGFNAWREFFGASITTVSDRVSCGDNEVAFAALGAPRTFEYVDEADEGDVWNGVKRLNLRTESWKANWCETVGQ